MKYQGLVKNRVNNKMHRTRLYNTWERAHRQAELLGLRLYGHNDNWGIDVITRKDDPRG